jgi:hypothetical protein
MTHACVFVEHAHQNCTKPITKRWTRRFFCLVDRKAGWWKVSARSLTVHWWCSAMSSRQLSSGELGRKEGRRWRHLFISASHFTIEVTRVFWVISLNFPMFPGIELLKNPKSYVKLLARKPKESGSTVCYDAVSLENISWSWYDRRWQQKATVIQLWLQTRQYYSASLYVMVTLSPRILSLAYFFILREWRVPCELIPLSVCVSVSLCLCIRMWHSVYVSP